MRSGKVPSIIHFDIPADNPERAKNFYSEIFGWKIEKLPGPLEYYMIETTYLNGEQGIGGGMAKREMPDQRITNFIEVPSVDEYIVKIEKLGGKVVEPKTVLPEWGYLAVCLDTENNLFGIWEENENAK